MNNLLYSELFGVHAEQKSPFLFCPDGKIISYGDFIGLTCKYAHVLTDLGVLPGERLLAQVQKSPEGLALYAACIQTGIIYLPVNIAYTVKELSYFIEDSQPALVVCDENNKSSLAAITGYLELKLETLNQDGSGSLPAKAQGMPCNFTTVQRDKEDLAVFLYTSGTTGFPKAAMLTQENLLSNARALKEEWQFDSNDVLLHALPLYHSHGLFVATNVTLLAGGSMIFLPKFDLDQIIEYLPQTTTMMGVPTFYTRLLASSRLTRELTKGIRLFISGSAPLLAETHTQFTKRTGHSILERYGLTETSMNTSNPYEGERRPGTVGFPLPGIAVKITDEASGKTVPSGKIGQIEIRGPNVCKGYWQKPKKTAEDFRQDGFFITGDLGRIDSDGYIHIVGRNKDLIISGGYNVYPKEIELVIDKQPGVLESAAVGVPHADFGESVLALIVPCTNTCPDFDQITTALASSLAPFKLPKKLELVDELPRNTMGKVQKNVLRDRYKNLFNPTSQFD